MKTIYVCRAEISRSKAYLLHYSLAVICIGIESCPKTCDVTSFMAIYTANKHASLIRTSDTFTYFLFLDLSWIPLIIDVQFK